MNWSRAAELPGRDSPEPVPAASEPAACVVACAVSTVLAQIAR